MGFVHSIEGDFLGGPCQELQVQEVHYMSRRSPWGLRFLAWLAARIGRPYTRFAVLPSGRLSDPGPCYLLGHRLFLWPDD
jgi:hypothetical protein